MKSYIILIFLSFFYGGIAAQKTEPNFNDFNIVNQDVSISNNKDYKLIMVSGAGCGYCDIALKNLLKLKKQATNINITIYEFGGIKRIANMYKGSDYFKNFVFINAEKENILKFNANFLPFFYLYKNGKLIWKEKGIGKNTIDKIFKKVEKYR
ncbi:MAG: hypothetical protein L3J45_10700 [Flavobacteriaceae bacterium]|nr:hypothetical protein [Flavobacteriaceae bacterium]